MAEQDSSTQRLERVVGDLRALSSDIESCAVLGEDGKLLYSSHGEGADRERVTAMLAALSGIADRTARQSGKERASRLRVKTDLGHLLLVRLAGGGTLAATTGPEARVGLVLYDMKNVSGEVEKAMGEG